MMGEGRWEKLKEVEQMLDLYKKATKMHINMEKSILSENSLQEEVRSKIRA